MAISPQFKPPITTNHLATQNAQLQPPLFVQHPPSIEMRLKNIEPILAIFFKKTNEFARITFVNYPETLQTGEASYPVEYQQVRKSTSSVRIKSGVVVLRLSRYAQGKRRDEIVAKFLKWAGKRLEKMSVNDFVRPKYVDGGRVVTHNKVYELRVKVIPGDKSRASLEHVYMLDIRIADLFAKLHHSQISKKIQFLAEKLIMIDQQKYLEETVAELNQLYFQEKILNVRFKRTTSRFGSCSSKRNINIALRLLFAPREVFRYVCVHELAHLKEFNHSARFWQWVESAMSDYRESEKWLKKNGFLLG